VTGLIFAGSSGMSITRRVFILSCVLLGASHAAVAQKYGVTVNTVKPAALAPAKTYVWGVNRQSFDKKIDALIVAAVDRELSERGFSKVASGSSDVVVTYASLSRTDVDLKQKPKDGASAEIAVGTLLVDLSDPNRQTLFRVRMDTPIELNTATNEATVNGIIKQMFEKYPPRSKR